MLHCGITLARNKSFWAHYERERSISAKLTTTLTNVRARMRIAIGFSVVVAAIPFAAFAWICVQFAVAGQIAAANGLAPAALGLGCVIGLLALGRAILTPLPDARLVRDLDFRADARGELIAALELSQSTDSFARAAVTDAQPAVDAVAARVPALYPLAAPAGTKHAVVMFALALLCGVA